MKPTIAEVYFAPCAGSRPGKWKFRLRAGNGRVIAPGSQGYTRRRDAVRGALRVARFAVMKFVAR